MDWPFSLFDQGLAFLSLDREQHGNPRRYWLDDKVARVRTGRHFRIWTGLKVGQGGCSYTYFSLGMSHVILDSLCPDGNALRNVAMALLGQR
ncbi:hypothetical protein, partial [Klebsiella pneumoniae]|uniref:hypothetical protein n=1 Tax=Klebsiella pneumoniae TaxID=573 RepID=UPI000DFE7F0C